MSEAEKDIIFTKSIESRSVFPSLS